jgi:hypothetical protein
VFLSAGAGDEEGVWFDGQRIPGTTVYRLEIIIESPLCEEYHQ